jgi:hypothetical protein
MRMARVNISLPDQLVVHAKGAGLNISQLAARAISDELNRLSKLAEFDAYLAELRAELGPPTPEEEEAAEEWANRVLGPLPDKGDSRRSA